MQVTNDMCTITFDIDMSTNEVLEMGAVLGFRKLRFLNCGIRSSVYMLQHNGSIYGTTCVFTKSSAIELM